MGGIQEGEEPAVAAAREVEEETGWRPGALHPLLYTQPSPGISDSEHHIFLADTATTVGEAAEDWEAQHVDWVSLASVPDLVARRTIVAGTSMTALLYAHAIRYSQPQS